jgi:hypothetical protein
VTDVVHLRGSVVDLGGGPVVEVQERAQVGLQIRRERIADHGPGADQFGPVADQDAQFSGRLRIGQQEGLIFSPRLGKANDASIIILPATRRSVT